jgi:GTPase SAR1 family protein
MTVSKGELKLSEVSRAISLGLRPIVVLGDVGVGKTSFFENLFQKLDDSERASTFFIHLNLGLKATLSANVKFFILQEIPRVLKHDYHVDIEDAVFVDSVYHEELKAFDRGIYGRLKRQDPIEYERKRTEFLADKIKASDLHLRASLCHLAHGRKKQIVIVIDNTDQRSFEIQQEAFLIAQELASLKQIIVFISIRPSTFYKSKVGGTLAGYQNRVLTVNPAPAHEIIKRRISFAVRVAEGKIAPSSLEGIKLNLTNIVLFLKATLRSVEGNPDIQVFLSNISGGNTRAVIELITSFCGSPNVDSEKIVRIEKRNKNYRAPLHEFAKHALLGEFAYYNPQSSLFACNVYDVSTADSREHFVCALILSFLDSPASLRDHDGFVKGKGIVDEIMGFAFSDAQVRFAIRRLAERRLIETPHGEFREVLVDETEPPDGYHFRLTSIGSYHIRFWSGTFAFLDAVSIDTPIFDIAKREVIFDKAASFDIRDRFAKAELFRQYLLEQWYLAAIAANYFDFAGLLESQSESFRDVKSAFNKKKTEVGA